MVRENIIFFENNNESYTMVDLYIHVNRFIGYKDSYNYYDIDVDNILLFKKSYNEYIIRYNDVNKMTVAPIKLIVKDFYGEVHELKNDITLMFVESDDKEHFLKS